MRLKIIAGNLVAVLIVGLGAYFYVKSDLEKSLGSRIDGEITNDYQLFARSWRLSAYEFLEQVGDRAATREVRGVFLALDDSSRRQRAHAQANNVAAWFQDPARNRGGMPDLVALTDETGRVIARNQDINRMNGTSLVSEIPTIRNVIAGAAQHDAWLKDDENKLLQVAMAPIRNDEGTPIGVLLVGYDISNGIAVRESEVLGRSVAFIEGERIYSSSIEATDVGNLQSKLFGELQASTQAALAGTPSATFVAELAGEQWLGIVAPLPDTPSQPIAFAVLGSRTAEMEPASVSMVILVLMAVGLVFVLIYGFVIGTSFIRPVEQIEEGILTVINGRTDFRLDVESSEFGGLAYRINQLINVFTGVAETDEDGRSAGGGGGWEGPAAPAAEASGGGGGGSDEDPAVAAQLAAEPEAEYEQRIYDEYVAAKQAAGEDVSNIPKDRFLTRLRKNAENLTKKHGCKMVRFQVQTRGNQVILRPVIIR
ncbi:MAG: MXAN_5187 C-terminal domain-containing protein [Myxococcota bacterium]